MGKKRAKVKSEKKKDTTEEESEEEQIFVVEVITSARVAEDADGWVSNLSSTLFITELSCALINQEYRVKWKGFESEDDTWEPEENILSGCEGLLSRFWKEVGTDNDDYPPGAVVAPGDAWIVKERRRSAKAADSDSENEKTRKRRKHHGFSVSAREIKKEKKTVKKKNKELKNFVETLNDETSDEDTPLSSLTSKPTTPALETNDPSKTSDHDLDVPRHPSRKVRGIKRKVDVISGEGNRPGSSKVDCPSCAHDDLIDDFEPGIVVRASPESDQDI
ncbi:hypothetical protein OF83DRAFT_854491 [Amylostereum chailletii]|nr:hypothetical protein OF83DRAFT_854491 [Amylostereum chailletii]